jgi:hypothetical protein
MLIPTSCSISPEENIIFQKHLTLLTRLTNKDKTGEAMKTIKEGMTKIKEADSITTEVLAIEEDSIITSMEEGLHMLIMMIQKLMQIYRNRKKIRENL